MRLIINNAVRFILITSTSFVVYSCATTATTASPLRFGYGINTMPGWELGTGQLSLHAVLGYARVNFKGGGGHNNFLQFGPQLRWSFDKTGEKGAWAGAEITYLGVSSKYDGNNMFEPKGSGFTIGPAAGYRFQLGKVPLSVYFAPSFMRRGDLKDNGMTAVMAGNGFYGRLGIDLHFMSLLTKKGK